MDQALGEIPNMGAVVIKPKGTGKGYEIVRRMDLEQFIDWVNPSYSGSTLGNPRFPTPEDTGYRSLHQDRTIIRRASLIAGISSLEDIRFKETDVRFFVERKGFQRSVIAQRYIHYV